MTSRSDCDAALHVLMAGQTRLLANDLGYEKNDRRCPICHRFFWYPTNDPSLSEQALRTSYCRKAIGADCLRIFLSAPSDGSWGSSECPFAAPSFLNQQLPNRMTGGLPRRILFEKESERFKQLTHHSSIHSKQSEREQTAHSTKNFSVKMPFRRALWAVEILVLLAKLNSSRGSKDLLLISLMHCFFSYNEKEPSDRSPWRLVRLQIQSCRVQESQTGNAVLLHTSFEVGRR